MSSSAPSGSVASRRELPSEALPLAQRAKVAQLLLGLVLAIAVFSLWADATYLAVIEQMIDGERVAFSEAQRAEQRAGTAGVVYGVGTLLCAITFLLWYSRAYRNVIALGLRRPRFGTRWAVGSWFVPILNLFRPKQVVNDIWRAADPGIHPQEVRGGTGPVPGLIHAWWFAWIVSGLISHLMVRSQFSGDLSLEQHGSLVSTYVALDIADAVAALLAILVVRRVTGRVEERRARWGDSPQIEPVAGEHAGVEPRPTSDPSGSIPPPPVPSGARI